MQPRSRDFGSPQCRLRLYIVGVQQKLQSTAAFSSMVSFIRGYLPQLYRYDTSIKDIADWIHEITDGGPKLECGKDKKDLRLLQLLC